MTDSAFRETHRIGLDIAFVTKLARFGYDAVAAWAAFMLAANFSFTHSVTAWHLPDPETIVAYGLAFAALSALVNYSQGLHRGLWRYTSLLDFQTILRAATITSLVFLPIVFLLTRADSLPRSTIVIAWFLLVALSGGPRVIARSWADSTVPRPLSRRQSFKTAADAVAVLVAGDSDRIEAFVRELRRHPQAPYRVVGILTDERARFGHNMHGVDILGSRHDLRSALAYLRQRGIHPQRLVIADDGAQPCVVAEYLEIATAAGLTLGRLPRLMDFDGSGGAVVQPIAIGDLLGRPQAVLDRGAMRDLIAGKRVLVTGAGGSIGSELVRQISDFGPASLTLIENSEFNLYSIDKELSERHPELARRDALCDVRDRALVNRWFAETRPQVVFHAAALKHVPLVESHPLQGVRTNILGTQNVADACLQYGASTMVLISTDKAVNPHNVMGASKRCAEAYCQALDSESDTTRFVAVRFGNVLGSAGSVVPLFQRQLAAGGPITVTHPDIERFFMTIPEAVALVLQASALGTRSDEARGGVYVLDMGKPVKIVELARRMIRLAGKRPDEDIKIEFVGLRPGEKLYEELVHAEEQHRPSQAEGVMIVSPRTATLAILRNQFAEIAKAAENFDRSRAIRLIRLIVPELVPEKERDTA